MARSTGAGNSFSHIATLGRGARACFGIESLAMADGEHPVSARDIDRTAFQALVAFDCPGRAPRGTVLLVPPISGVRTTLMREALLGLLPDYRVLLLEWLNPRHVPLTAGTFGFEDNIGAVIRALRLAGPGTGLVALCQSGPPALAAVAVMEAAGDPAAPAALALLGAPVDPAAAATDLSRRMAAIPPLWLQGLALGPVPFGYPGAGRLVYSAERQYAVFFGRKLHRLFGNLPVYWDPLPDFGEAAEVSLSLSELARALVDIEGRHFIENIDTVFRRRALPEGRLLFNGAPVVPRAITRCALLTLEGEADDMVAPGQTAAAHALCPDLPVARHQAVLAPGCTHLSLFRGPEFGTAVLPVLRDFLGRWVG